MKRLSIYVAMFLLLGMKSMAQPVSGFALKPQTPVSLPYTIPSVENSAKKITPVQIAPKQIQAMDTKPRLKINTSGQCALFNEIKSSLYLQGKRTSESLVDLKWQTKQLYNKRGFEIQRSFNDTIHFITIGFVQAQAQSQPKETYASADVNESMRPAYYRLKQIKKDTGYAYSNIVLVNGLPQLTLFPNPVSEILNVKLQCTENSNVSFVVYDSKGVQVINQSIYLFRDIINTKSIRVHRLPAGAYNLEVINSDTTLYSKKFIKE